MSKPRDPKAPQPDEARGRLVLGLLTHANENDQRESEYDHAPRVERLQEGALAAARGCLALHRPPAMRTGRGLR